MSEKQDSHHRSSRDSSDHSRNSSPDTAKPGKPEVKSKIIHKPEEAKNFVPVPILRTSSIHLHGGHSPVNQVPSASSHTDRQFSLPQKVVSFIDGSAPGSKKLPEDEEHKKIPCFEPSPAAVSDRQLDIPEESWSDLLRNSSDVPTLRKLINRTSKDALDTAGQSDSR